MAPLYVRSKGRVRAPAAPAAQSLSKQPASSVLPFGLPSPEPGVAQLPAGVSLCMIVKNEERFLAQCLRSVAAYVDEICIVDTGSTDRTLEIARSFGSRIEHREWRNDFAWARNEALAMATKRWILILDADEELDPQARDTLAVMGKLPAALVACYVRCNNLADDYKGSGVSSHALVRFIPNSPRIRFLSPIHEFVALDSKGTGIEARVTPLSITHHGYLAEIVKLRNKSERNFALVKAAVEANPDDPFSWYNLGITSLLVNDPVTALSALEKMRVMVGEQPRGFVPNGLAQLADLYSERGDHARAIEAANASLRKSPHFANAHFSLGRALSRAKRYPEARAAFEAAIADEPYGVRQFIVDDEVSVWKAHSEVGGTYAQEGNDIAALEWFERALERRPQIVPLRLNRARALERLGRYEEAAAMHKSLAQDEPGDVHSVDYINFLLRHNEFAAAAETIAEVLTVVCPRTRAALLVTAAKLVEFTGSGDSESFLTQAVATDAGAADALEALEAIYRARGDEGALDRLRLTELAAPMELVLAADHARRATRYISAGRLSDAETVTLAGLEKHPSDAALRYNLATILVQTDRKEAALAELATLPFEEEIGVRAAFLRAVVLADLARYPEAIAAIDNVIARAPNEIDPRLQRFRFADALGWDDEAETTLRRALELGDSRVAAELATWLLRKGRLADAQSVAERALQSA